MTSFAMKPLLTRALGDAHGVALGIVLVLSALYFAHRLPYGWIPSDSGVLAQSAARVLDGHVPHHDFDEYYTGGLTLLHAGAMALLGERLASMRWLLLCFALGYLASLYRIAARVASPIVASGVTLCAAVWSVPNYFVPLPSWYNLFFATFGLHALLCFLETGRQRWLFVSGLMAGLSFLIKIVSLYAVAATLFTLLYREQSRARSSSSQRRGGPAVLLFGGGLLIFLSLLLNVLASRLSVMVAVLFLLPAAALVCLLLLRLWESSPEWGPYLREVAGYLTGALLPVSVFLAPYLLRFGMAEVIDDVVLMPRRFFGFHGARLPEDWTLVLGAPWGLVLWWGLAGRKTPKQGWMALGAALLLGYVLVRGRHPTFYQGFWASVRPLVPIVVVLGCVQLRREGARLPPLKAQRLFAVLATAGLCSLIQFPFSAGIYFCFTSGTLLLAGLYLVRHQAEPPGRVHATLLAFYATFAVLWLNYGDAHMLGWGYHPTKEFVELSAGGRGGIRVYRAEAEEYERLVARLQALTKPGEPIYVATDAPEVAFLADRPSPMRTMFDVLDADYYDRPAHDARVLETLEAEGVPVVVLNVRGGHSGPPSRTLVAQLERRYPHSQRIGRFQLRWRSRQR